MEKELSALTPEGFTGREFVMDNSYSCWISVDSISVYILNTGGGVAVELLPLNDEMDVCLGETWAAFPDKEPVVARPVTYHSTGYCFSCGILTSDRILEERGSGPVCLDCYRKCNRLGQDDPNQMSLEF